MNTSLDMPPARSASGTQAPSRSVSVRKELAHRIEGGLLAEGGRLPSEPALATELGVSRATLREALRALESEGLVLRR